MSSGMINKVAITKANVTDDNDDAVKAILPSQGAVTGDKGFVGAIPIIEQNLCHTMIILKSNMKQKNKDKYRFVTKLLLLLRVCFPSRKNALVIKGFTKSKQLSFCTPSPLILGDFWCWKILAKWRDMSHSGRSLHRQWQYLPGK